MSESNFYIETEKLSQMAEEMAQSFRPVKLVSGRCMANRMAQDLRYLNTCAAKAAECASTHTHISETMEWLLDNRYIAEREGKSAMFTIRHSGRMPAAKTHGEPSIASAAAVLIEAGQGLITEERIISFFMGFQRVVVFEEREIGILIPVLKAKLISYLAGVCENVDFTSENRHDDAKYSGIMKNIFSSLRFLGSFDATEVLHNVNLIEQELYRDPAKIYEKMDEETRQLYRGELAKIAKKVGITTFSAAKQVVALAEEGLEKHVGYYIFRSPLGKEKTKHSGGGYIGIIVLLSFFITVLLGFILSSPLLAFLLLFPVSEIVKNIVDYFVIRFVHPKRVQRLEFANGIPKEARTICVISALLSSEQSSQRFAQLAEEYKIANRDSGEELLFGILADLPEANSAHTSKDEQYIAQAISEIEKLNDKYGGGFYFFCRDRKFSKTSGKFMGWERKRGAIIELTRLLRGRNTSLKCYAGNLLGLNGVRYIITLDSDTRLCAGAARELIGAAMHPLNRPVIDEKRKVVSSGYGIIQPRISIDLCSANRSDFTKIFAGQGGIDPYGSASSDIYQDLFERGSFNGKGILDVDAFASCIDGRFPENSILSHDLLEGEYIGCAYMGDTELTDGYPYKVTSYYDRMHRWVRGDWQISPWLGRYVKNETGDRVRNPMDDISKWKVFDNLRRSLVPVFTFAALLIGMLVSRTDMIWAAVLAVLTVMSNLLISSADLVIRRDGSSRARYHSTIISGFAGWLMQALIQLMLLPFEAWICFSAIISSLYRMYISRKNLLMWVPSEDAEIHNKNSVFYFYNKMWICVISAVTIILLTPYAFAAAIGIVWLLTPLYAFALSRKIQKNSKVAHADRMYLLHAAGDIWKYFQEFATAQENYLPPDNWQQQPAIGIAHRTSPTNIGLALLSALSAYDLGIISVENALGYVENILATVQRLPKWNGHLYNWYDTTTLKVLEPGYVSTVDSGNFAGCLIVLREELFAQKEIRLAEICTKLLNDMSFKPLFDNKRKLFYIGWDIASNQPTEGWYDLLESEARQTSYIAIARGEVPRKHWRKLGRALVSQDNYSGMASWTGTMFEYLMPNLILPCYQNSLLYESSKFCVYAQKKRASSLPWGVSESAFYAFDPTLNYQYKAHGVQRLALKRKMDFDMVVAPYASFLALSIDVKGAVRNLRRLAKLGMEGRYGFYEAIDFTESRQSDKKYEVAKTFMAHHLGMSLIAINNALNNGIMQKRFMQDREMAAFSELLQEKVPIGQVVLRQAPREVPEKPKRAGSTGWTQHLSGINWRMPQCALLSNGSYSVLMTEAGHYLSKWNGIDIMRCDLNHFPMAQGVQFYFLYDGKTVPLVPNLECMDSLSYQTEFSGRWGMIHTKSQDITAKVITKVSKDDIGEQKWVILATNGKEIRGHLLCVFEPILQCRTDFLSHPAFSRLSLEAKRIGNDLLIKRRKRGEEKELYLAFTTDREYKMTAEKMDVIERDNGITNVRIENNTIPMVTGPEFGICAEMPIDLTPGADTEVRFAFAVGYAGSDVLNASQRILSESAESGASHLDKTAQELKMSQSEIEISFETITHLLFGENKKRSAIKEELEKQRIWQFGISGDVPLLSADISNEELLEEANRLVRQHCMLNRNGFQYDLALVLADGSHYRSPMRTAVIDYLRTIGWESALGKQGGIHLINQTVNEAEIIRGMASYYMDTEKEEIVCERKTGGIVVKTKSDRKIQKELTFGYNDDNSFSFLVHGKLPSCAWSHILANNTFGFIATDAGTGHMWHLNARENKINRWLNDNRTSKGTETLYLCTEGKRISLFAAEDGYECRVTYGFGYASWEKQIENVRIKTTAFVPENAAAKVFIIDIDGAKMGTEIAYFTDLILGSDVDNCRFVETMMENGIFSAHNKANQDFPGDRFFILASENAVGFTSDKIAWASGKMDERIGTGMVACAGMIYPAVRRMVIVTGCEDLGKLTEILQPDDAQKSLERTINQWKDIVCRITFQTPDENLNHYLNGWALYQTIACRIKARTSLYQCGGAYGFRDQLQDICAVIEADPTEAQAQILRAAAHQYEEGDVQHWWHPGIVNKEGTDRGIRTKCSDDLLWLPYALCEYVDRTGNTELCDITVFYLKSPPLEKNEQERYEHPNKSQRKESVLLHAMRACDRVLARGTGEHGLCLIGTGDWNDGMNRAGANGHGESVWLTWFASMTLARMGDLCEAQGYREDGDRYRYAAENLRKAADSAWDGRWYLRGYYDDGKKMGSVENDECSIDSIVQSFAALCGGSTDKVETALHNAVEILFDRKNQLVKLFDPPFIDGDQQPGYIKSYYPGFRENGGQYTHGAVWLALALFKMGDADTGAEILHALLPYSHDMSVYKAEPYVLAADVYTATGNEGRGGWSWYTGAAGWYYRVAVEELLGLKVRGGKLYIEPNLPASWPGYEATMHFDEAEYKIHVENGENPTVTVNDIPYDKSGYPLKFNNYFICKQYNL